ncbi:hypothetical protein CERSUDRAFT_56545 [Gelatoporia subvermispora B]|uniref:DUF6593 domain-containing protein n=1 Tax=Ceriporiopsis subvermispora (strain B) TaxID=914234 RepID=M2Q9K8_CERS8|nr:hypothetical protein CERSUDRAFT_56545 [Gelatoporia subvermispora B]
MTTLVLSLQPDNPCNTTITDANGKLLYSVKTEYGKICITYVRNSNDEVIASSRWREYLPDKVTIGDKRPTSLNDWLHKSIVPFVDELTFNDDGERKYKWKGWSAGRSLELFSVEDGFKDPIAHFIKMKKDYSTRPPTESTPAQLVFTSRGEEIRDTVVISFLFLEKTRRMKKDLSQNVMGIPGMGGLAARTIAYYNGL